MSLDPQAALKARIKQWLVPPERSRDWLATKLGTSSKTVDNWLSSSQKIPQGKALLIERLMADDEATEAQRRIQLLPQAQIFSLEVDLPTFRAYSSAALANDKTLEQWAIAELNAAAEAALPDSITPLPTKHPVQQAVDDINAQFSQPKQEDVNKKIDRAG